MDKQIIEISNNEINLSLERGFVKIENKEKTISTKIPIDNILSIVFSAENSIISKNIINAVCENGGSFIMCGKNYLPTSIIIPYTGHWLVSSRIKKQISSSLPLNKNLWRQIIQSKIYNQALVLEHFFPNHNNLERLKKLSKEVLSNDSRNNEAMAAKIYFKSLFGKDFIRDRMGENINILLNYCYIVLRASVARGIAGNGLLPYLGIKHCMKSNPLPLVDDIIEPFRPIADMIVFKVINDIVNIDKVELTPEIKRKLTTIISYPVNTKKGQLSLSDAIYDFSNSLVDSYETGKVKLSFPEIIFD